MFARCWGGNISHPNFFRWPKWIRLVIGISPIGVTKSRLVQSITNCCSNLTYQIRWQSSMQAIHTKHIKNCFNCWCRNSQLHKLINKLLRSTWNFTWFTWTHVSPKSEFTWNTLSLKFRFSTSTHANLKLMRDNDSWKALLPFTFIVSWFRAVSTTLSVVGKVCKIENRRKWRFRPWRSS